jgi:hypothetical protein
VRCDVSEIMVPLPLSSLDVGTSEVPHDSPRQIFVELYYVCPWILHIKVLSQLLILVPRAGELLVAVASWGNSLSQESSTIAHAGWFFWFLFVS